MNKICVFIPTLMSGGAEKQAMLLTKVLCNDNHAFLVLWRGQLTENKFIDYIEKNRINTIYLKGSLIVRLLSLVRFLRKEKINIIFAFLASNNLYGSIAGKISGTKFIIGGIRNAEIPKFKLIIQKFLHNYILNYTIFNNYSGKDNLIKAGFKKESCYVIPNCFELEIQPITRDQKKEIKIISLARFVAQKDYPTALLAIEYLINVLLKHDEVQIKYQIIGYGELELEIRNYITKLHLDNFIEIIINPTNIPSYLENADIFLTTSLYEGTSNSMMEAMSFSLPIVATKAGDNDQLVDNNLSGFLCEIGDFKNIAEGLFSLINDYEKRITFGSNGYNKLKSDFSMEKFKERYMVFMKDELGLN